MVRRVERLLGGRAVAWTRRTGGYTPAARWAVELGDGRRAFLKMGATSDTAEWVRREARFYGDVAAPWLPKFLGWEDAEEPILALEDLSGAHWPPPWRTADVERVLATLRAMAATRPPDWLPSLAVEKDKYVGWPAVAEDPAPLLALKLCSAEWLAAALPALLASEAEAAFGGDGLVHLDVRSDNLCFDGERTLLIDWNFASVGNPVFDVAFWLPSLAYEGGPLPEDTAPEATPFAAAVSGFFAARAGLPDIRQAPFVRRVQREQLSTALPWVQRVLGLPPLDGPG